MKTAITRLLSNEGSLNDKLDLLTAIEITVRNEKTYQTCLEVRDELIPDSCGERNSLRRDVLQAKDEQVRQEDSDGEGAKELARLLGEE